MSSIGALAQSVSELPTDCSAYQSVPLPAEAGQSPTLTIFPDCASYRSYRGIGRPQNFNEARMCAWRERQAQQAHLRQNQKEPTAWVIGGSLILADIYINGAGVQRNIPLAVRFACEFEEDLASTAIPEIAKFTEKPAAGKPFEFCDYAGNTFTENFCSDYKSQIAANTRDRYYTSIRSSMTSEQKDAFDKLLAASDAYIDEHSFEVDQGGTIRTMRTIASQNILKNLFRSELAQFERKKWPALSENQVKEADISLNGLFQTKVQELNKQTKEQIGEGAVAGDDLTKVEKSWDAYRDAWFAFARLRYPSAAEQIRAQVTIDRYRLLKTINSYQN